MNRPLRLTECFVGVCGMFTTHFVGGRCIINNPFRMLSRNVRNVLVICVLHIRRIKVWFLRCKSMVFAPQKYGFWRAKTPFLHCKNPLFEMQYTKQRTRNNEVWYYI